MARFKLIADENIANSVLDQLQAKGVEISRITEHLPLGEPDWIVLAYAHDFRYALLTHDERIIHYIAERHRQDKEHAGVFIAGHHLQGEPGIGPIVTFLLDYHELIEAGAGNLNDDVFNQIIYV